MIKKWWRSLYWKTSAGRSECDRRSKSVWAADPEAWLYARAACQRVGKSREHITNLLRLLKLPEDVQDYAINKELSMGHIRALLSLKDEMKMRQIAKMAIDQGLSVGKSNSLSKTTVKKKEKRLSRSQRRIYFDRSKKANGGDVPNFGEDLQSDDSDPFWKWSRSDEDLRNTAFDRDKRMRLSRFLLTSWIGSS